MKRFSHYLVILLLFSLFLLLFACKSTPVNSTPTPTVTQTPASSPTFTPTHTSTPTAAPTSSPTPAPSEKIMRNVIYKNINNENLHMDIYLPAQTESSPLFGALFFFHGGGWMGGDKSDIMDYYDIVKSLNAQNIVVIAVQYRLCNSVDVFLPTPIYDCLDAVRYIVKNAAEYNIDVNNLGAFGTSAGGHLALMSAFAQDYFHEASDLQNVSYKLKYVVDFCGPTNLCADYTDDSLRRAYETLLAVFGAPRDDMLNEYEQSSPIYYIENNSPKTLIIHGKADTYVPYTQSELLYSALIEKSVDVTYVAVEGAEHDFSVGDGYESTSHSMEDLLFTATQFILNASAE